MMKEQNAIPINRKHNNAYYNSIMEIKFYDKKGMDETAHQISTNMQEFAAEIASIQNKYVVNAIRHLQIINDTLKQWKTEQNLYLEKVFTNLIILIKNQFKKKIPLESRTSLNNQKPNNSFQEKQSEQIRKYIGSSIDLDDNEIESQTPTAIHISDVLSQQIATERSPKQKIKQKVDNIRERFTKQQREEIAKKQFQQIYTEFILIIQLSVGIILTILKHFQDQSQPSKSWNFEWIQPLIALIFEIVFRFRGKFFCCDCCERVRNCLASRQIKRRLKQGKTDDQVYESLR